MMSIKPWNLSNFQDPPPPVYLRPKVFRPLDLGLPILNKALPPPTNYGTTTAPCMWTNEIKTITKSSHVTFKLITRSIVRLSPQTIQWYHNAVIKGWLHCLTPELIGRILVKNTLFDSAWYLVIAQLQFSLIKK